MGPRSLSLLFDVTTVSVLCIGKHLGESLLHFKYRNLFGMITISSTNLEEVLPSVSDLSPLFKDAF